MVNKLQFWAQGHFDTKIPPYLQSLDAIESAMERLISSTSSHEGSDTPVGDALQRLVRSKVIRYNHQEGELSWRRYSVNLPLSQVCQSLAMTQLSSMSVLFSNYNGLKTMQLKDLKDYVQTTNSVRIIGTCNLYDIERIKLKIANFLTRLDLVFNADIDGRYLAPFLFELNGTVLHAGEWYPMYIDKWNHLLSPESNSEYYKFLKRGNKAFTHRNCGAIVSTDQKIERRMKDSDSNLSESLLIAYRENPRLLPPLSVLQKIKASEWKNVFGENWQQYNASLHADHQIIDEQSPSVKIRLSVMIYNRYNFRSDPNHFGLLLTSITQANNERKASEEIHSRNKRAILTVVLKGAQLVKRAVIYLYRFFQSWFSSILGNNLTNKVVGRSLSLSKNIGNKLTPYWQKLKDRTNKYIAVLRPDHEKSYILQSLGPFHNRLLKHVATGTSKGITAATSKMKFGPGRYSLLTLPRTIPTGFVSRFSTANKRLRKRLLDAWIFAKKNKASLSINAAGIALFSLTDYAVQSSLIPDSGDDESENEFNPLPDIPDCSDRTCYDPDDDDPLHVNPLTEASVVNDLQVIGSNFYYAPEVNQTMRQLLQDEIFPSLNSSSSTAEKLEARRLFTTKNYDISTPNIYDLTIDQTIRQKALVKQRKHNQVVRFKKSFTYAYTIYGDISPSHKKTLICTQQFLGFLTLASRILSPDELFLDQALDLLVSLDLDDRKKYCNEIAQYLLIAYKQLEEQRSSFIKTNYDVAGLSTPPELIQNNTDTTRIVSPLDDLQTADFEVFSTMLRVRGQQSFKVFNSYLDRIVALNEERKFWVANFKMHRLLWQKLTFTPPNVQNDYLQEFVTYFSYISEDGIKTDIDQFLSSTSNLTAIRLYGENLAVGFSTRALESQISSVDLKTLKKDGIAAIVPRKYRNDATNIYDADAQIKSYDELLEAANSDEDFLEFAPELDDFEDETSLDLLNRLQPDVTPPKKIVDQLRNTDQEQTSTSTRDNVVNRIKRHVDEIFQNMTSHPGFLEEHEKLKNDPEAINLFILRSNQGNSYPLRVTDFLKIHQSLKNETMKTYRYHDYIEKHYQYLKKAVKLISDFELDAELMALFADNAVLDKIPPAKRQLISAASSVLKIDPLNTLAEKSALVYSLDRVLRAQNLVSDEKPSHNILLFLSHMNLISTSLLSSAGITVCALCMLYYGIQLYNRKCRLQYSPLTPTVSDN